MKATRRTVIGGAGALAGLAATPGLVLAATLPRSATMLLIEEGSKAGELAEAYTAAFGWNTQRVTLDAIAARSSVLAGPIVGVTNYAAFVLVQDIARSRLGHMVHAAQLGGGKVQRLGGYGQLAELEALEQRLRLFSTAPGRTGALLWAVTPA